MTAPRKIRVLAVDDHLLLRKGIAAVIEEEDDLMLVGEAATGKEAIERFRVLRPDVTLMDLQLPDMNGIEVINAIRDEFSDGVHRGLDDISGRYPGTSRLSGRCIWVFVEEHDSKGAFGDNPHCPLRTASCSSRSRR